MCVHTYMKLTHTHTHKDTHTDIKNTYMHRPCKAAHNDEDDAWRGWVVADKCGALGEYTQQGFKPLEGAVNVSFQYAFVLACIGGTPSRDSYRLNALSSLDLDACLFLFLLTSSCCMHICMWVTQRA
jgi:hypothetical protein